MSLTTPPSTSSGLCPDHGLLGSKGRNQAARHAAAVRFFRITVEIRRLHSRYQRQPLLGTAWRRDLFLMVLEQVRQRYQFVVVGYVVMPEHFHLLISEPQERTPSTVMQALKLGFARRVLIQMARRRDGAQTELSEQAPQHIWQKRFYDFNVWTGRKRVEKLRYIHRNPVERGLVASPELWTLEQFPRLRLRRGWSGGGECLASSEDEDPTAGCVKIEPSAADCAAAHFSQRTREMGHPVWFLGNRAN